MSRMPINKHVRKVVSAAVSEWRASPSNFDLFRPSRGKAEVGISAVTLYKMVKAGLPLYRSGRMSFISKSELAAFIRARRGPVQEAA